MCTVSIVPDANGFRVISNRDERRDRASALQPTITTVGNRAAILPLDPVGGGSWIGVNDTGLVATVLNRYATPLPNRQPARSRGLIVRHALASDSLDAALQSLAMLDATEFQPFRLVLVERQRIGLVVGDGRELASGESRLDRPFMFTASSLGDVFVDMPRRQLFECLMTHSCGQRQGQLLFHRHQWPDKPDISVVMERNDAATVSRTTVDVSDRAVALEYEPLIPGRTVRRLELASC